MNKDIVSFDLKGNFACFRKNDTNDIVYTTYNFIHRPAVLGILGAILGYKGYAFANRKKPEYYEKLKNLKVAIEPLFSSVPPKMILTFNNSSGLASSEKGGALQVKEQVMVNLTEKISYRIYIDLTEGIEEDIKKKLCEKLDSFSSEYSLYLGKNEFLGYYDEVKYYKKVSIDETKESKFSISTLIPVSYLKNAFKQKIDLFDFSQVLEVNIMFEILPVDFDDNFIYVKDKFAWIIKGEVLLEDKKNVLKIIDEKGGEKYIYFIGKKEDI